VTLAGPNGWPNKPVRWTMPTGRQNSDQQVGPTIRVPIGTCAAISASIKSQPDVKAVARRSPLARSNIHFPRNVKVPAEPNRYMSVERGAIPLGLGSVDAVRLSIKDTFIGITSDGSDSAVVQITEFVAGCA
jgi:hypothetical protein